MDRRKTQRKGSYKNKNKQGLGIFLALLVVLLLVGVGVFAAIHWQWFDFAPKVEKTEPQEHIEQTKSAAEDILKEMTLEEKVYQMLFVTPESVTGYGQVIAAGDATREALAKYPVGGIVYFASNLQNRDQVREMLGNTQSYSKIPLFLGVDEEGGRVARLSENAALGVEALPSMREIGDAGDTDAAYNVGKKLAERLTAFGFNLDFAPVADVLIHSDNTEIGDRAFGSDVETVAKMVPEVVSGLQGNGVSAVLKHFPGHGSALTDSHTGYSESLRSYEQLQSEEFVAFKTGIDVGANFVMVSHVSLVNVIEDGTPSSLSKTVITQWLREELGFQGVVITDSLQMGVITDNYTTAEAAVLAVQAGADMLLMPANVPAAAEAVVAAVQKGEISEERIDESVGRILTCKERMGILQ